MKQRRPRSMVTRALYTPSLTLSSRSLQKGRAARASHSAGPSRLPSRRESDREIPRPALDKPVTFKRGGDIQRQADGCAPQCCNADKAAIHFQWEQPAPEHPKGAANAEDKHTLPRRHESKHLVPGEPRGLDGVC